jgi:beta-lactamase class A
MTDAWAALRDKLDQLPPSILWSVKLIDVGSRRTLFDRNATAVLPTASVGKVLLLVEVARQIEAGLLDPTSSLVRTSEDEVYDSGLWQFLAVDTLAVADLAVLVGAVSDNLATNVLLRTIGVEAVNRTAAEVGFADTRLYDRVRIERTVEHPSTLSRGSAAELAAFMATLATRSVINEETSSLVLSWLSAGVDLSLVAQPFGIDPLAHATGDRGLKLWHKTGTDAGTRADVGLLTGPHSTISYAAIASWDPAGQPDLLDSVLSSMHMIGSVALNAVSSLSGSTSNPTPR